MYASANCAIIDHQITGILATAGHIYWGPSSVVPKRCGSNFESIIFKLIRQNSNLSTRCEIPFRWIPQNLTNGKSTLVQMMAWCRQTAGHYLSQCQWPRFMSPYGVTSSQWVNWVAPGANRKNSRGIFEIIFTTSWQLPEPGIKKCIKMITFPFQDITSHWIILRYNKLTPRCLNAVACGRWHFKCLCVEGELVYIQMSANQILFLMIWWINYHRFISWLGIEQAVVRCLNQRRRNWLTNCCVTWGLFY